MLPLSSNAHRSKASLAIDALNELTPEITEYARSVIEKTEDSSFTEKEQLIRFCYFNHPEYNEGHVDEDEFYWKFDVSVDDDGVWIRSDQSINTDHAAIFTQSILTLFDLDQLIVINASHTCSKPRLDAFGGHSVVVTKESIRWSDGLQFIESEQKAHDNKENYYFCEITEINGEYEYRSHFLMTCKLDESPEERLDNIFLTSSPA